MMYRLCDVYWRIRRVSPSHDKHSAVYYTLSGPNIQDFRAIFAPIFEVMYMDKKKNLTPDRLRVGIYVRVSTLEQAEEGHSIGVQTEKLQAYCVARGWDVYLVYTDPGFSGSNMERPALKRMLADVQAGHLDMILVYKLDRLSRSQRDTLYMIEDLFLSHNVDFVSITENFDTSTPLGRAMIGILSVFAQLEREQIKERMAMGRAARASSGLWRGGAGAPTGYDYIDGHLVINEYEAMQIRTVFDLFLSGNTFHGIQAELQRRGYTTKHGSWKNTSIISKVLRNSTYIGKVHHLDAEYDGKHPAIISMDTWNAAQIRLNEVLRGLTDHQKSPFKATKLLTGFIWCGDCGARYFFHSCTHKNKAGEKKHYNYYQCYTRAGHKKMRQAARCTGKNWKYEELDDLVISEIKKLSFSREAIEKIASDKSDPGPTKQISAISSRLEELERQLNKVMDLYTLGNISFETISQKAHALAEERERLQDELNRIKPKMPALSLDEAFEIARHADAVFSSGSMEEQRTLLNSLIKKIVLYPSGDIEIFWKFV